MCGRLQWFWSLAVILHEIWSHYQWLLFSTWGVIQNKNAWYRFMNTFPWFFIYFFHILDTLLYKKKWKGNTVDSLWFTGEFLNKNNAQSRSPTFPALQLHAWPRTDLCTTMHLNCATLQYDAIDFELKKPTVLVKFGYFWTFRRVKKVDR